DAKLDVLLQGPRRSDIECRREVQRAIGWHARWFRDPQQRRAGWDELADAALDLQADLVVLGESDEPLDINVADVARLPTDHHAVGGERQRDTIRRVI